MGEENEGIFDDATAAQIAANGHHLSALYGTYARRCAASGQEWELFALACLARAHYSVQTFLSVLSRHVDGAVITRSIYEHVVTFAWLLVEPEGHYPRFLAWEWKERQKLAADSHGFTMIEKPDEEIASRALAGRGTAKAAPEMADRAEIADKHWKTRVQPGWGLDLRHGYAMLYRPLSVYAHPTVSGIDPFILKGSPLSIGLPTPIPHYRMVAVEAVKCFGDALAVSSVHFGWPPMEQLVAAFTHGLAEGNSSA